MRTHQILIALITGAVLCSGCATAKLRPDGLEAAARPMQARFKDFNEGQRQDFYDAHRLTWDGYLVAEGGKAIDLKSLAAFLSDSGASDLAAALAKAKPAYVHAPNPDTGPSPAIFQKDPARHAKEGHYEGNVWIPYEPYEIEGKNSESPKDFARDLAAAGAVGAAAGVAAATVAAAAGGAVVGTRAVVDGIWSDLNPNPTLEDVLEAYNQRLAFAMGLNASDAALFTSAPRPGHRWAFSARDQLHGRYVVKSGIFLSLGAMGASAIAGAIIASQNHGTAPNWVWPVFFGSLGGLVANLVVGYSVVW